ncbi:DUF2236 domain-containing protein [Paeniglutamicibacter antarcticus]|uniref:DUF2236 domain-containing protein n=1 Tax=Arthrobacter terrae TaxID=2935737 RepID=A0A931G773_9MICC|nr:DUF2236 domain-containing protein [Arthrobacter terrae]MBG0741823.1 DUF2236 domain-containing protein [Arthrobacter terrae]
MHASLADSFRLQQQARPEAWAETFREMVLFDLAADMELGFFLAYYRNFAVPSIAETLNANGEIPQRPMKRSYDTAIVIYEMIVAGLDSDRGRHMTALLNHVHRHVPGTSDDFRYVLLTLLVVPIRWTQKHGWRKPISSEIEAATRFFLELGQRMHLESLPRTFEDAAVLFDAYEASNVSGSGSGRQLMDSTIQVLQSRLPRVFRPVTRPMIAAMLDDDRLSDALSLPRAKQLMQTALSVGLAIRNAAYRRRPLNPEPHFSPGKSASSLYPDGYTLDQIGPMNVTAPAKAASRELP